MACILIPLVAHPLPRRQLKSKEWRVVAMRCVMSLITSYLVRYGKVCVQGGKGGLCECEGEFTLGVWWCLGGGSGSLAGA